MSVCVPLPPVVLLFWQATASSKLLTIVQPFCHQIVTPFISHSQWLAAFATHLISLCLIGCLANLKSICSSLCPISRHPFWVPELCAELNSCAFAFPCRTLWNGFPSLLSYMAVITGIPRVLAGALWRERRMSKGAVCTNSTRPMKNGRKGGSAPNKKLRSWRILMRM